MKKNYGLMFSTNGRAVSIDYNEKMIKKGGQIKVFLDEDNTAQVSIIDWAIQGHKRFKRLRKLFGEKYGQSCGILIDGSNTSIVFKGESEEKVLIKKE